MCPSKTAARRTWAWSMSRMQNLTARPGETVITGPFKALRSLKPDDPVKLEEKKDKDKDAEKK